MRLEKKLEIEKLQKRVNEQLGACRLLPYIPVNSQDDAFLTLYPLGALEMWICRTSKRPPLEVRGAGARAEEER